MNRVLSVIATGILTGISCTIGMKIAQNLLDKIELSKTKNAKIIKIRS